MIRRIARNKFIIALLSICFGIYLIAARRHAVEGIIRIGGYISIGAAVAYLLYYFFGNNRDEIQLGYAVIYGVIGLLALLLAPTMINVFEIAVGIILILAGVGNLTAAREAGLPLYSKVIPIVTIVIGVLVVFHPGSIMNIVTLLAGIALVINGLNELDIARRIHSFVKS